MAKHTMAKEHRTVSRITQILESIASNPDGLRLMELAQALDAPKSSVHGLVKGLVASGYLSEDGGGYILGPAIGALLSSKRPTLMTAARRSLEDIERQCHESVVLSSLVGESVVYIDLVESSEMIRLSAPLKRRRPLYPSSAGKCFLAHFPDTKRHDYVRAHIANVQEHAQIEDELCQIREEGISYNWGQTFSEVFSVAAPVIVNGRIVASLAVAGPRSRMADKMGTVVKILKTEAANLSLRLA